MSKIEPDYSFWRTAMQEGVVGSIIEDEPQPGFYKIKTKEGFDPVAIFYEAGECVVVRNGLEVLGEERWEVWMRCAKKAIPHDTYHRRMDSGEWPDAIEKPEPTIGHNSSIPESEVMADEIESALQLGREWLKEIGEVTTQEQADKAANYADRYAELERKAEEKRKTQKEPHLEAGRAVDREWKPVVDKASKAKSHMKDAVARFLIAENARRKAAAVEGTQAVTAKAGTRGRSVAIRSHMEAQCTDADTLWSFYKDDKRLRSPEVCRRLMELAAIDLEAGKTVQGAKWVKVEKAA